MTLQIKVELGRVSDYIINHSPSGAVPAPIRLSMGWEEPHMVAFANDNHSNGRVDIMTLACGLNLGQLPLQDVGELALRNTITIIHNPLREFDTFFLVVGFPPSVTAEYLIDHILKIVDYFDTRVLSPGDSCIVGGIRVDTANHRSKRGTPMCAGSGVHHIGTWKCQSENGVNKSTYP